ncbi:hypothetical protein DFR52_102120 [Hoeflea marina]|uniref:DNA-binding CsgD family transcriptional regulator n=2 Tax=Hoeflea marina TaxID=274592 RepID=A0A317PN26_9HYPH|nr:hypothetical protein DFR52_102120 [Hoeflea marina]
MDGTDRLIRMVYESALEPESWSDTAAAIGDHLGAGPIHLMLSSLETGRDYVSLLARGNPDFATEYLADYAPIDFRVPRVMAHQPGVYIDERSYVSREEARVSPIHQEYLLRQEIYNISGANLSHDGCIGWFGVSTLGPSHDFDARQRRFLELLSRHVFTAIKLTRRHLDLGLAGDLARQSLDMLNAAVAIIANNRVLDGNAAFGELLKERFLLLSNGALSCADPAQAESLTRFIARRVTSGEGGSLVLRHHAKGVTYLLQCQDLFSRIPGQRRHDGHRTVTILELGFAADPGIDEVMDFGRAYEISRAEAEVLQAVLSSRPLGAIAEARGVRLDTVQKQLKSAMRKTELNSQKKIFQAFERYRLMRHRPAVQSRRAAQD